MSRLYIVKVSESVHRVVHLEDSIECDAGLLPILSPERMAELLAKELEDLETGLEIEVDPATAKLRVRLSGSKEIDVQRQKTVTADPEQLDAEPLRARLRASAERGAAQQEATLQRQLTSELEKQLADIRPELDRATNRATIAALKARAAELGEIREVHEDPGGENVVIRVKV